jgi:hypothetical protein
MSDHQPLLLPLIYTETLRIDELGTAEKWGKISKVSRLSKPLFFLPVEPYHDHPFFLGKIFGWS